MCVSTYGLSVINSGLESTNPFYRFTTAMTMSGRRYKKIYGNVSYKFTNIDCCEIFLTLHVYEWLVFSNELRPREVLEVLGMIVIMSLRVFGSVLN